MRTTIDINDAILAELRRLAAESRRPLRKVVEDTLQRGLTARPTPANKIKVPTFPVGVKKAYLGMSMNQLYDQLEAEDYLEKGAR